MENQKIIFNKMDMDEKKDNLDLVTENWEIIVNRRKQIDLLKSQNDNLEKENKNLLKTYFDEMKNQNKNKQILTKHKYIINLAVTTRKTLSYQKAFLALRARYCNSVSDEVIGTLSNEFTTQKESFSYKIKEQ